MNWIKKDNQRNQGLCEIHFILFSILCVFSPAKHSLHSVFIFNITFHLYRPIQSIIPWLGIQEMLNRMHKLYKKMKKWTYLFHKASPICVWHSKFVQIRLGKHGGNADNRQWHISRHQLHRTGRHGPYLDLFERLVPGSVAGFTNVHVFSCKSLRLYFEIILQKAAKILSYIQKYRHTDLTYFLWEFLPLQTWPNICPEPC